MSDIIKAEIKRLVDLVNDQTKEILEYPDSIPLIELDLVKESLRRLYQHVNYLSTSFDQIISQPEPEIIIPSIQEITHEEPEVKELDETDLQAEALMNDAEAQLSVEEVKVEDSLNKIEEELQSVVEEIEVVTEKVEIPTEVEAKVQEPVNAEAKEDMLLVDQIGKSTISSLKSAIGINDKFQFINELFDGSMPKYNTFIKQLDAAADLSQAQTSLINMLQEQNWDKENPAFTMLQGYLERRF